MNGQYTGQVAAQPAPLSYIGDPVLRWGACFLKQDLHCVMLWSRLRLFDTMEQAALLLALWVLTKAESLFLAFIWLHAWVDKSWGEHGQPRGTDSLILNMATRSHTTESAAVKIFDEITWANFFSVGLFVTCCLLLITLPKSVQIPHFKDPERNMPRRTCIYCTITGCSCIILFSLASDREPLE